MAAMFVDNRIIFKESKGISKNSDSGKNPWENESFSYSRYNTGKQGATAANHLNEKNGFSQKKGFLTIDSHLEIIDLCSRSTQLFEFHNFELKINFKIEN